MSRSNTTVWWSGVTRPLIVFVIVAGSVLMLAPLLWALGLSFKPNEELLRDTNSVLHGPYTLKNYVDVLLGSAVLRWTANSFIVSLGTTAGVLALSSIAGYGFARLTFPGRRTLFVIVLCALAIPEQAVILARHQLLSQVEMHNTYLGLMLPGLSAPFGVVLMTQYFKGIPTDIDEAALMDHASRFRVFYRVLLPLTWPAQATLGIFTFLVTWNDYWWPMISATDQSMYTLTVGIAATQINFADTAGLGFLMAQAVFASMPIFIVYAFFQKYIVRVVSDANRPR